VPCRRYWRCKGSTLPLPHSLRQALGCFRNPGGTRFSKALRLPLDEAIAIVVVLGVVFANLIADLLYAAVNLRIRCKQGLAA